MTDNAKIAPLRTRILLPYAMPASVIALPTIPVTVALPSLYGIDLGLGLGAVGAILLAARAFDTISDPLIGALSDRTRAFGARRKPWIGVGALIAGIGLWQVLVPPDDAGVLYLLLWSIVLYSGWTMVAVPYLAWGAELTSDYRDRARVTSWREGIGLIGIVAASALAAIMAEYGMSDRDGLHAIAGLTLVCGLILLPLALFCVPDRPAQDNKGDIRGVRAAVKGLRLLFSNILFSRLLLAWFVNGLANGIPAALFLIYLDYGLKVSDAEKAGFVLLYFLSAVLAIPAWLSLVRHFDKHRIWCWAMLAASFAFAFVPIIPPETVTAFALVCLITGAAFGADLALPPAIQADVVDYDRMRSHRHREGLIFSFWGMSTKMALAASAGLALPGVVLFGFDPDQPTEAGTTALILFYAGLPVAFKLIAVAIMWGFPLGAGRHDVIRRRLAGRNLQPIGRT